MKFTFPHQIQIDSNSELEKIALEAFARLEKGAQDISFEHAEGFLSYLFDDGYHAQIRDVVSSKTGNGILPKTVFVIGIGGANLATKAIYDAHLGFAEGIIDQERKMIFLDTNDAETMSAVELHIGTLASAEEFALVLVSKSGKTIETLANAEFLVSRLENVFGDVKNRMVVVTTATSQLCIEAKERDITCVLLPEKLSDRFSAFSPTTTIPLALFGFPVGDYLSHAQHAYHALASVQKNSLLHTVNILDTQYKKGSHILDTWFFAPHFETLGKWHRQLAAESLGKSETKDGKRHRTGFTPIVSIGTIDLHSSLQLTLAGPKERITEFVSEEQEGSLTIGDAENLDLLSESLTGKTPQEISKAILQSVTHSYAEAKLPYFEIMLPHNTLEAIAQYMVYSMLQTYILGTHWNLNVFDQPNVESYKTEAREILSDN
jgi:glucose-6-phosphate isomerase